MNPVASEPAGCPRWTPGRVGDRYLMIVPLALILDLIELENDWTSL